MFSTLNPRTIGSIILLAFGLGACASTKPKMDTSDIQVINLQSEFEAFWRESKGKPFETQVENWNKFVERPHQSLYDHLVNGKKYDKDWETRKTSRLKRSFVEYERNYPNILQNFSRFSEVLNQKVLVFRKYFPDAMFDLPIIALPGATFNGKAGPINDQYKMGLAFSIDIISERGDDPGVLYSHELFHIYHVKKIQVTPELFEKAGKMTLPLWLEGLATYASQEINPKASVEKVLMQDDLAKLSAEECGWLANEFLKIADLKAEDDAHPERYRMWFGYNREKLRPHLPYRVGYLLGLRVASRLAEKHSLSEMALWPLATAESHVKKVLNELAAGAH